MIYAGFYPYSCIICWFSHLFAQFPRKRAFSQKMLDLADFTHISAQNAEYGRLFRQIAAIYAQTGPISPVRQNSVDFSLGGRIRAFWRNSFAKTWTSIVQSTIENSAFRYKIATSADFCPKRRFSALWRQ